MVKVIKDEFKLFPDLHFGITQLIEIFGKEDREFYDLKANEESLRIILSGDEDKTLELEKKLKLIKQEEEQKMFSLEALSGSLLQILKAKIYSKYSSIEKCPKGRFIFSHLPEERPISVRDIIISGRIQYNHPEGITDKQAKKVFDDLAFNFDNGIDDESDKMFTLEMGKVLAYNIMTLLNWTRYKGVFEKDMILLFDPEFEQIKRTILDDKKYLFKDRKRLLSYLISFSTLKNNMKKESTDEVLRIHDSIGVKAEMMLKDIGNSLSSKKGKNKQQKDELNELLRICDRNNFDSSIYNYN
ncbi:hypothetical protein [Peribacillus sp. FSL P2-0133]|uniref:hypothetical protein n=1 Tax=Peribacillus sp. FSL P2-0133 TaxID=2921573 RepID=UPI0030D237A5